MISFWRIISAGAIGFLFAVNGFAQMQPIPEYTILKAPDKIVIDGKLDEPGWKNAPFTAPFVVYTDASVPRFSTRAKLLWDDTYLYIAFVMNDSDVWAKTKVYDESNQKNCLCNEEVAEIYLDPDGDGLNYLETEINSYGAVMDLLLDKEFKKGGHMDLSWGWKGLKTGITIQGTLNDSTDVDKGWTCEFAFPFREIAPVAPSMNFPPKPGDTWHLNLYRYNYDRATIKYPELSAWSQTDRERGFHAPDRFGKVIFSDAVQSQTFREYTVKRAPGKLVIDGRLNEPGWHDAELTEPFMIYNNGSSPKFPTQAKMLWDNDYLYIAFIMTDEDVWGKTSQWKKGDQCLCREEVAEVFIDPDGDSQNYMEIEVNPLKAVMDLTIDHELGKAVDGKKGNANFDWDITGFKIGVTVDGTLNNQKEIDKRWICELAFPFKEMAFSAPGMSFPPKPGDSWRLNLYRYDYGRDDAGKTPGNLQELTAWNQTDNRGFHAPDKFGKIIFSNQVSRMPKP
ncbi:MAG: carbohydrate-binding family 9-like protein [Candidatus Latescibacter sp.]|nr:carbohydrate-binding family 9-like protein [Candidatus Latescibacter sp.]